MSLYDERPPAEEAVEGTEPDGLAVSDDAVTPGGVDDRGASGLPGDPTRRRTPMTRLAHERDEYLRALQRTQADFENYRKRIARQQGEKTARGGGPGEQVAARARHARPGRGALQRVARPHRGRQGAARRGPCSWTSWPRRGSSASTSATSFDPSVHDAVAHTEGEPGDTETMVDEVLRSGYRWKGQALRPAMVRVRG